MAREPFATRLTAMWIGGFFFWMLTGFRGKFSDQIVGKRDNQNLLVGYIIQMIVLVLVVYFLFFKK